MSSIVFTVTNDLTYDQRMIRICSSLEKEGFSVLLVGREMGDSVPLTEMPFRQKRLVCFNSKGFFFYAEFNIRLFFFLLFTKADILCAIDLDTIMPCLMVSSIRRKHRVYDAHELFCEMKEVVTRPGVYRFWKRIEKWTVPHFKLGYTVNNIIAEEFRKSYQVNYEVIRNMPVLASLTVPLKTEKFILYQGAVNEGRCFETLVPAMKHVQAKLVICGDGNFMEQTKQLATTYGVNEKIVFTGKIAPEALKTYTSNAYIGITLFEKTGMSNYFSLANRFFDYMHAGIPQICVDYPVYRQIINQFPFALLISDTSAETIASELNRLLSDEQLYNQLQLSCMEARKFLNWQEEEKKLIAFYHQVNRPIG